MVQYFIDGGPFMWPILIALVFGLGFALERAYSLVMSSINSQKFFTEVSEVLQNKGVDTAIELCNDTRGPVAEIFHAGLLRTNRGLEEVAKAMAYYEDNKLDSCNTYELKYVHTCLGDTPINFEYGKMCKTQDLEPIKSIAYSVQIVRTKVFMKEKHIFCGKHGMYGPISKKAGMLVKTPEDIKIINAILHYHSSIGYYEGR